MRKDEGGPGLENLHTSVQDHRERARPDIQSAQAGNERHRHGHTQEHTMRRPYRALAFSGIAGIALPASAFVVNVATPARVGRIGYRRLSTAGGPSAPPPPLAAGMVFEDGEATPRQRERRETHPSAAM